MSKAISPWKRAQPELAYKARVFELRKEKLTPPGHKAADDFYYIDTKNWVNVIALTEQKEVVMVEQYRVGIDEVTLELPGGIVDLEDADPREAGTRELLEETGYGGAPLLDVGQVHPNPAMMNNRSITYLARGVSLIAEQKLDPSEQIIVHLIPIREILAMIREGIITHSLVVCAFHLYFTNPELFKPELS